MNAVLGIDHVGVTVPDIEAATEFFRRALGAETLYDTLPRAVGPRGGEETARRLGVPSGTAQVAMRMLRLPHGPGLELFEFRGPRQREAAVPSDLGWQHLACYTEDLPASCAAVRAAGGRVLGEPHPLPGPEAGPGNRFVYCRTPWGSTLELLTYPGPMPYEDSTPLRRWRP
ncbi:glyoxalase [Streptomyces albus subsp. chlorinus]|uniref:VOC family protein n=1 Tax=Streptomyces albus TaxID=1888 RepID=UPI00156E2DD6|nr:VOC family protein [Streptomyces albus]NSC24711.1 glyoxalase [Streptomyces albus subsp. chlorinus]